MQPKKWLISFLLISLAILVLLGAFVYAFDPYYRYHGEIKDYKLLKSRYSDAGLIYNYEYDTVMIGSSLMQNFDMNDFNEKLGCRAIKATIGGISLSEIDYLTKLILEQKKCSTIYCCIDLALLAQEKENDEMRFSEFLYDDYPLNDYQYLFGYEVWMRFLPVDIGIWAANKAGISLPEKVKQGTDPNYLEYWADNYTYGEEETKEKYLKYNNKIVPETVSMDKLYGNMKERADEFIGCFSDDSVDYVIFFPPYSILYWHYLDMKGYYEDFLKIKQYICEKASEKSNIKIYDFQLAEKDGKLIITDLDNYKDPLHYGKWINVYMTDCFVSGDYAADPQTVSDNTEKLGTVLSDYKAANADWLRKE